MFSSFLVMSESSESDLSMLMELSDWDSDFEDESHKNYKTRINHMNELNSSEFTYRFRLNKTAVRNLLTEIYPLLKVTSGR